MLESSVKIVLTSKEAERVACVGVKKAIIAARTFHKNSTKVCSSNVLGRVDIFKNHIQGVFGEYVFRKHFCLPINDDVFYGVGADFSDDIQIRSTSYVNGCLNIRKGGIDNKNHRFVFIRGIIHKWEIVGWCYGHEGMDDKFFKNHKSRSGFGTYLVPADRLRPINTLEVQ